MTSSFKIDIYILRGKPNYETDQDINHLLIVSMGRCSLLVDSLRHMFFQITNIKAVSGEP
jgi:hypothetical protein